MRRRQLNQSWPSRVGRDGGFADTLSFVHRLRLVTFRTLIDRIRRAVRSRLTKKGRLVRRVHAAKAAQAASQYRYHDDPDISLLLLSFNHRENVLPILNGLRASGAAEIIVCEDGSVDGSHAVWARHLNRPNEFLIRSNDLHEIRSYNRAAGLARGRLLCILQDDDIPPENGRWLSDAVNLFDKYPRLAVLGGHQGYFMDLRAPRDDVSIREIYGFREGAEWSHVMPIPWREPQLGIPFMFVEGVSIGPIFYRTGVFRDLNGLALDFSQPGESGILSDHDISLRAWLAGWQVAAYGPPAFRKYVGGQGTVMFNPRSRGRKYRANMQILKDRYLDHIDDIIREVDELNKTLAGGPAQKEPDE